ncbi:MAG: EamA family transporter [Rhodospirillales bacterium]|nr:EamA family transporter [Rhodospirillales bacterium]MDE2574655.1 EamA family transporter [Rhodospirillales bacterium]
MELWIPITLLAALCQTWRTAMQQKLRGRLSVNAASFVRYVYALPVDILMLTVARFAVGRGLPAPNLAFLGFCAAAGLLQVVATSLLILSFGFRGYAVGTAYSKTEALQAAIFAWIILGEALHPLAWVGIGIGVCGVLVLSLGGRNLRRQDILAATFQPAALCGLSAGLCFAFTAIFVKEANLMLGPAGEGAGALVQQAMFVLVVINALQTLMQGGWMAWREPDQLRAAFAAWRQAGWVGALSALGSGSWFTAFSMAPVALVRALGQIEMVLTLLFGHFYLKEKTTRTAVAGLLMVVVGVLVIIASR